MGGLMLLGCAASEEGYTFSQADMGAAVEGHAEWASPPGWEGVNPSCNGEHGTYGQLYVNATAAEEDAGSGGYAEGSTMVLVATQDAAGTPKMTVAMHKVAAASPLLGDWYWAYYAEDGALLYSGNVPACWNCHETGKDYTMHRGRSAAECDVETAMPAR